MRSKSTVAWLVVLLSAVATSAEPVDDLLADTRAGLYVKQPSLSGTMLETRRRYHRWLDKQQPSRAAVAWWPWHTRRAGSAEDARQIASGERSIDLAAKTADGQPTWIARAGWKEGQPVPLTGLGIDGQHKVVCLHRKVTAARPVSLTVGFGGGERIDVYLADQRLLSADTSLSVLRYGCSQTIEGTRQNQVLLNLPLAAGENELLVVLHTDGGQGTWSSSQFTFSAAPNPVPRFWDFLRDDFPPWENRLLEVVECDWFDTAGWFAAKDTALERKLLDRLIDRLGPRDAVPLIAERDALLKPDALTEHNAWLELGVTAAELSAAIDGVDKLRAAVEALEATYADGYPGEAFARRLDDYRGELRAAADGRLDPSDPVSQQLLARLPKLRREMLVAENPLLFGQTLLFAQRITYDSKHYYDDYYSGLREFGGNIYALPLDGTAPEEAAPRPLVSQLDGGVFDRYDLSYDATRLVFGYRRPKPEGFRIWETGLDGSGLRQLTFPPDDEADRVARHSAYSAEALKLNPRLYGHWTDDMHPCYLPDGRIAFVSSRPEHSVLCGGHSLSCTALYRTDADGGNLHRLSQGSLSEFTPTMLDDGRILYNRWEYIYKGIAAIQPLWVMRPDGGGSEEIYGDNITNPGVFVQARQVPERPNLIVATGCGHEPLAVGTLVLIDRHGDKRTRAAMTYLTPDTDVEGLRGLKQKRNGRWITNDVYGPFYCDPYPLDARFFLVACNPHRRYNDPAGYGIYLLDVFGNRVKVYDDPEVSCWQPMLMKKRRRPMVVAVGEQGEGMTSADRSKGGQAAHATLDSEGGEPEATVLVTDVYRGLQSVPRGTIRYLRVMEQVPRSWDATRGGPDAVRGQQPAISLHTHIWVAVLVGIVPVEEDGSAYFTVPADRNLFFQALDERFMEVQKMRTFVNFQPGETRSCIGCHEHRGQAPVSRAVMALSHPPLKPGPQPGEVAPRPIDYAADVQPVLDRHCIECHAGDKPDGDLDLSGTLTTHFNRSYENLLKRDLVDFIQEWTGPAPGQGGPSHVASGSMMHAEAAPPYTYGSHRSRLIALLLEGHEEVELEPEEFVKLVTWIDANAPYYGSYFGRRHIQFRGRPDFRPLPTLASARGAMPEPVLAEPIPAELICWWRLDETDGDTAADASGGVRDAKIVGAKPAPGKRGGGRKLDGGAWLAAAGLGRPQAVSVALWIKADQLASRWTPLLFTDGREASAFHYSILSEGLPNVAINSDGSHWVHNRARSAVTPGRWHHVAVVCDPRYAGRIRFYLDGRKDAEHQLDLGVPLNLEAFRVGAWNNWASAPANNFHGAIDEVRIYRGMLTDEQVAELAGAK